MGGEKRFFFKSHLRLPLRIFTFSYKVYRLKKRTNQRKKRIFWKEKEGGEGNLPWRWRWSRWTREKPFFLFFLMVSLRRLTLTSSKVKTNSPTVFRLIFKVHFFFWKKGLTISGCQNFVFGFGYSQVFAGLCQPPHVFSGILFEYIPVQLILLLKIF